jgi:hypothetical protein
MGQIDQPDESLSDLKRQTIDRPVRQPEELIEQTELENKLESRRMHSITAEIAEEICMFFQDDNAHPGTREQETQHHSGWSAADDATLSGDRSARHGLISPSEGTASACGKPAGHSIDQRHVWRAMIAHISISGAPTKTADRP